MAEAENHWNVLWSKERNAFRVEPMDDTLTDGLLAFHQEESREYILIASGVTQSEAQEITERWRDVLYVRAIARESKRHL
jgi:hypothetical protein